MARSAKQTRPQLVCVLADNSGSMSGDKARAATQGIREMLMECQSRGPSGPERSYFRFLLIRFDNDAKVDPSCDITPVRKIDPNGVELLGNGGQTNITAALQTALDRLRPYILGLQDHPERKEHPLPLVLVFSDGQHNVGTGPKAIAAELKKLMLDGEPVVIAAAGVSLGDGAVDEHTLREIASPECYVSIDNVQVLSAFICSVGSSGASRASDVAKVLRVTIHTPIV